MAEDTKKKGDGYKMFPHTMAVLDQLAEAAERLKRSTARLREINAKYPPSSKK